MVSVDGRAPRHVVTLQLGQPVFGVLQVRFAPGRVPDEHGVEQLASFAVRAAHALRSSERARDAGLELERSAGAALRRGGGDLAALAGAHPRDGDRARRAPPRLRPRRGLPDRRGRSSPSRRAAGSRVPHQAVADGLLTAALQSRQTGAIAELDAPTRRAARAGAGARRGGGDRLACWRSASSSATSRSAFSPSIRGSGAR